MANFITALLRQRNEAKHSEDTSGRLKEIFAILDKYDYDDGITPEIVANILQDLGPTFVKIGQIASQQSEQIPPEYCDELAKLRSSVAPMDIETVRAQIEKYLGKTTDELFALFDEEPLGAASIGQVHRAVLYDGTVVAVKVRRPGVVETVARDFALIEKALDFNMRFIKDKLGGMDLMAMIGELEHTSKQELDFTNEARNLERFWENNAERSRVACPRCYREYTNEAILTEDFAVGKEAGDTAFLETLSDEERDRLAKLVADNFAAQVLTDGFYHADPHSGNVLIQPVGATAPRVEELEAAEDEAQAAEAEPQAADGEAAAAGAQAAEAEAQAADGESADAADGEVADAEEEPEERPEYGISWIDFGMMGTLASRERQILVDLVSAVMQHDAYGLKRAVLQVATPIGEVDHGAALAMCEQMCDQASGSDVDDFSLGDLLSMMTGDLQDECYRIEPFLTNLTRGIIAAEGTVRSISPRVNILNSVFNEVGIGFDVKSIDPEEAVKTLAVKLLKSFDGNSELPSKANEVLDMLEKGQIVLRGSHYIDSRTMREVDRMVTNCAIVAMSIAVFLGSCIICVASDPGVTRVVGIPAMGLVGYLIAVLSMGHMIRRMNKGK